MQQLLRGTSTDHRLPQAVERVDEELAILGSEVGRGVTTCNPLFNVCDPIREVRCLDIDLPHDTVEPVERVRVVLVGKCSHRRRRVVGQQLDLEAVSHDDSGLDSRLECRKRRVGHCEVS